MGIQEQEALARQLHAIWKEAYGHTETVKWEKEAPAFREAWIQVAQFVEKIVEGAMANTLVMYGYNGKEPYEGLDAFIKRSQEPLATDANQITRIEAVTLVSYEYLNDWWDDLTIEQRRGAFQAWQKTDIKSVYADYPDHK